MNRNYFKLFFFAIIVAITTLGGALLGHLLAASLGLQPSSNNYFFSSVYGIIPFLIVTATIAFFIGELYRKLNQSHIERFISIFLYHYFFFYGFNVLDKVAKGVEFSIAYNIISHLIPAIIFSLLVTKLWKPEKIEQSFVKQIRHYLRNTNVISWSLRFCISLLMFVSFVFFTNWLIFPFLEQYDLKVSYNIPSFMIVKFLVGVLFVLLILPIFIRWKESKTTILFWIGFPIFLQIAVYPAIVSYWLPMGIRFPYLIQYTVIAFIMSIFYVQLFYFPQENEVIDDQFKWLY